MVVETGSFPLNNLFPVVDPCRLRFPVEPQFPVVEPVETSFSSPSPVVEPVETPAPVSPHVISTGSISGVAVVTGFRWSSLSRPCSCHILRWSSLSRPPVPVSGVCDFDRLKHRWLRCVSGFSVVELVETPFPSPACDFDGLNHREFGFASLGGPAETSCLSGACDFDRLNHRWLRFVSGFSVVEPVETSVRPPPCVISTSSITGAVGSITGGPGTATGFGDEAGRGRICE
jgi:hypothetical protein